MVHGYCVGACELLSDLRAFLGELKRRKVYRVAVVYAAVAFVAVQVADLAFPALHIPSWAYSLVVLLALIGFPIALVLAWAFETTPDGLVIRVREEDAEDGAATAAADKASEAAVRGIMAEGHKAVAVLPFLDLSAEHDQEYFGDGLTEELLNVLAKIDGLRVASRTSCFAVKGKDMDLQTVAEKLKVTHVVEGSVRKAGNRLRIAGQLIEAATDSRLWSEIYERELEDIFAIQEDIARQIAAALELKLHPDDLPETTTENARAYDYYLRGRSFFHRFGPRNIRFAIQMFAKATDVDPRFARAWSGLGDAHAVLALYYGGGESERAQAEEASAKAVALAPELSETHTSRGLAHSVNGRSEEAEQEFKRAIELDPTQFAAYYQYARTAYERGEMEKALALFEKAAEADPEDYQAPLLAAPIYRRLGDEQAARAAYARGLELAERHVEEHPDNARAYVLATGALHETGQTAKALAYAERALAIDPNDANTLYNIACYYAIAGEPDKALDCLERTMHSRSWIENDPDLDSLRQMPRFKAYLQRLE